MSLPGSIRAVWGPALLGTLILGLACQKEAPATAPSGGPPPAPSAAARWVAVRPPTEAAFLELPAVVLPDPQASGAVKPPYHGRIVRVLVRAGDQVTRGQPVAEIVMPEVAAAAGRYLAASTQQAASAARKRQLEALRAEGLVRQADLTEVELALADSRAEQQRARALLRSAGVDLGAVDRLVDAGAAVSLRSPIAGTVMQVDAAVGDTRGADDPPIVRVAGVGQARIEARLLGALPDQSGFEFIALGSEALPVRLVGQSPARTADGTARAWFEPQPPAALAAGTTGTLRIRPPAAAGLVLVPSAAVGTKAGRSFVRKRQGEAGAAPIDVEVVALSGADALVRSPLRLGDQVAAEAMVKVAAP